MPLTKGGALIKEIARKYHAVIPDRDTNAFYDDKLRVTMQAIIYFFLFSAIFMNFTSQI